MVTELGPPGYPGITRFTLRSFSRQNGPFCRGNGRPGPRAHLRGPVTRDSRVAWGSTRARWKARNTYKNFARGQFSEIGPYVGAPDPPTLKKKMGPVFSAKTPPKRAPKKAHFQTSHAAARVLRNLEAKRNFALVFWQKNISGV